MRYNAVYLDICAIWPYDAEDKNSYVAAVDAAEFAAHYDDDDAVGDVDVDEDEVLDEHDDGAVKDDDDDVNDDKSIVFCCHCSGCLLLLLLLLLL